MFKNKKLLDSSDESEEENGGPNHVQKEKPNHTELKINKSYAQNYEKWRCNEEAQKLKARYGEDVLDEEDSESSSSDDSDIHDEEKEKEFLRTLSLLRKKDALIYDESCKFFAEKDKPNEGQKSELNGTSKSSKKDKKPYLLKDHDREMILRGEADGYKEEDLSENKSTQDLPYNQELSKLKKGFSEVLNDIDSDEEDDTLLRKRVVTASEKEKEENDYRLWLKGQVESLDDKSKKDVKEMQYLKEIWSNPTLPEDEKFLRDYILNRGYEDPDEAQKAEYIPTYDEIIHDSDEGGLSGDEKFETERETFEHKYNFRYEEPDQEFIKRYPRTVAESLRRADEKRKKQREVVKEKRKSKKARKREEIQRLKSIKRKEILEKLQKLHEITGDPNLPVDDADIDGDFDPEEHDRRMNQLFNDNYYGNDDGEKPVFPSDEELDEINWEEWVPEEEDAERQEPEAMSNKKKKKKKYNDELADCEDPDFNMDADYQGPSTSKSVKNNSVVSELIEASKRKGSRKVKSSAFLSALERKKPKFDPSVHDSYQQYFDEYYKLDFEDLLGDMPCRFKYRKVTPNDFGLSTEEILNAEDTELNQWASVKKTFQYRAPEEELYELQAYQKKAADSKRKKRILSSLYTPKEDEKEEVKQEVETEISKTKKKKNKKKKKKTNNPNNIDSSESIIQPKEEPMVEIKDEPMLEVKEEPAEENTTEKSTNETQAKKKKKKSKNKNSNPEVNIAPVLNSNSRKRSRDMEAQEPMQKSKKEKRRHNGPVKQIPNVPVDDDRLRAYGINPKKFKKRIIYGKGQINE